MTRTDNIDWVDIVSLTPFVNSAALSLPQSSVPLTLLSLTRTCNYSWD